MHFDKLIRKRYSTRAFSEEKIENELIVKILKSALWAASARNEQPWRFLVAQKGEDDNYAVVLANLDEGNQQWAQHARVFIVVIASTIFSSGGKLNPYAWHDVGMSTAQLMLQATALGLVTHPMGGFNRENLSTVLRLTPDLQLVSILALGYPGKIDNLPANLQEREKMPRIRRPLHQFIYLPSSQE